MNFSRNKRHSFTFRLVTVFIILTFSSSLIIVPPTAYAQNILNLPQPGMMVPLSPSYTPAIVAGITIYPEDPLQFDFIIDVGDDHLEGEALRKESEKLISYFMATLTVPEDELWVNLSPYEKDRIIADGLGDTAMGRDMLAQDYILKQLTASLMYPEDKLGNEFWQRIYKKAQAKFGTTQIPTNTFNKIWIVPEEAVIYANGTNIFVADSRLKVMMEEDYLALEHHTKEKETDVGAGLKPAPTVSDSSSQIIHDILIPAIEKEVNEGKNFAPLRQIYHSMILATWYKNNLKESLLGQVYVNQNKTNGVDVEDKDIKRKIYNQYIEAFKKGVFNYIKEDYDSATQKVVPRKYFSGGLGMDEITGISRNTNTPLASSPLSRRRDKPKVKVRVKNELNITSPAKSDATQVSSPIRDNATLLSIPETAFNLLENPSFAEALKGVRKSLADPMSMIYQNIEKAKRKFIDDLSFAAYTKFLKALGQNRSQGPTVHYPYGGIDSYVPLTIVDGVRDVLSTGQNNFGTASEAEDFLKNHNNIRDPSVYLYHVFDGTDFLNNLTINGNKLGGVAILRIMAFLNVDIDGIYYFDITDDGTLVFLSQEDINDPNKAKSSVIQFRDQKTGERQQFWYIQHRLENDDISFRRFIQKIRIQTLLIKAAPAELWNYENPMERRKAIEETLSPATKDTAYVIADTTQNGKRRDIWRSDYSPEVVQLKKGQSFGYSGDPYLRRDSAYDVYFGRGSGLVTVKNDNIPKEIELGKFLSDHLAKIDTLRGQYKFLINSEIAMPHSFNASLVVVLEDVLKNLVENLSQGSSTRIEFENNEFSNKIQISVTSFNWGAIEEQLMRKLDSNKDAIGQLGGTFDIGYRNDRKTSVKIFIEFDWKQLKGEGGNWTSSPIESDAIRSSSTNYTNKEMTVNGFKFVQETSPTKFFIDMFEVKSINSTSIPGLEAESNFAFTPVFFETKRDVLTILFGNTFSPDELNAGDLGVYSYKGYPIALGLRVENGIEFINLTDGMRNQNLPQARSEHSLRMELKDALIHLSELFKGMGVTFYDQDFSSQVREKHYFGKRWKWLMKNNHIKIPIFPGIWNDFIFAASLVNTIIKSEDPEKLVLDLGAGAGNVSVELALEGFSVDAVDISPISPTNIKASAAIAKVTNKVRAWQSNGFKAVSGKYDVISLVAPAAISQEAAKKMTAVNLAEYDINGQFISSVLVELPSHLNKNGKFYLAAMDNTLLRQVFLKHKDTIRVRFLTSHYGIRNWSIFEITVDQATPHSRDIDFNADSSSSSPINFGDNGKSAEENRQYADAIHAAVDEFIAERGIDIEGLRERVSKIKMETKDPVKQLRRYREEVFTDYFMHKFEATPDSIIKFSRLFLAPIASEDILDEINTDRSWKETLQKIELCVGQGCIVHTAIAYLILQRLDLGVNVKIVFTSDMSYDPVNRKGHASLALVSDAIVEEESGVLLVDPSAEKSSDVFYLRDYFTSSGKYLDLKQKKRYGFFESTFIVNSRFWIPYTSLTFLDGTAFYTSFYQNLGFGYLKSKQYDKAITPFQTAIKLSPFNEALHSGLGIIASARNDPLAIKFFQHALRLHPSDAGIKSRLGILFFETGQYDVSIQLFKEVIDSDHLFVDAHFNLGMAYLDNGQYDEAVASFHATIKLDPSFAEAYFNLGFAYFHHDQYDKAVASFIKAFEQRLDMSYLEELPDINIRSSVIDNLAVSSSPIGEGEKFSTSSPGGIDFNPSNMTLKEQERKIEFDFPGKYQNIQPNTVIGVTPVIINITPIANFSVLLGFVNKGGEESENVRYTPSLDPIHHKSKDYLEISSLNEESGQ